MHQDPHRDVQDREEEDERELTRAAIAKLNELRRHSLEVSFNVMQDNLANRI